MATYLITGCAGFIGSNLVRALLSRGEKVRGIDNFSTGRRENLQGLSELDFFEGDIGDSAVTKIFSGVDYVLHEAAIPSVARSVDNPLASHEANVTGTLKILEKVRHEPTIKRVVLAASSSAYGDTPVLPKVEEMATAPLSPYAVSKLAAEMYGRVYARIYKVPVVALRYFNVFGPWQSPNSQYAAVIPKFIQCALKNEPLPIYGDGKQSRDFTYIDNVVDANVCACLAEGVDGEVFNIAGGQQVSLLQVVDSLAKILGKSLRTEFLPSRSGDVRDSLAGLTKAKKYLGYTAAVSFEKGLANTVQWHQQHASDT